jgi:hypothetical protein
VKHLISIVSDSNMLDFVNKIRVNTQALEADGLRLVSVSHAVEPGDGPEKYTAVLVYFE